MKNYFKRFLIVVLLGFFALAPSSTALAFEKSK